MSSTKLFKLTVCWNICTTECWQRIQAIAILNTMCQMTQIAHSGTEGSQGGGQKRLGFSDSVVLAPDSSVGCKHSNMRGGSGSGAYLLQTQLSCPGCIPQPQFHGTLCYQLLPESCTRPYGKKRPGHLAGCLLGASVLSTPQRKRHHKGYIPS